MAELTPAGSRLVNRVVEGQYQSWGIESDRFGTRYQEGTVPWTLQQLKDQLESIKSTMHAIALGDEMPIYDQHTAEAQAKVERALAAEKAAEARLASSRANVEQARAALEAAKRAPAEPAAAAGLPTVVTFSKTFGRAYGQVYDYAAVRPTGGNRWALTGRDTRTNITWAQLVAFMRQDEGHCANQVLDTLVVASSFEAVTSN